MGGQGTDVVKIDDHTIPLEFRLYELENQLIRGGLVAEPMEVFYLVAEARQTVKRLRFNSWLNQLGWFSTGFVVCAISTIFAVVMSW